jgi:hypothetical protein
MQQDSQKYSVEAGTVIGRSGMRHDGQKCGIEAETAARRLEISHVS